MEVIHNCFLTCVNFENNNNINNFCIIKILQNEAKTAYFLHSREGRIGHKGKEDLDCYVSLPVADLAFRELFKLKTGLSFEDAKTRDGLKDYYIYQEDDEPDDIMITISDEIVALFELLYPKLEKRNEIIVIPKKNIIRARQLLQLINDSNNADDKYILSMEWHTLVPMCHDVAPGTILNIEEKIVLLDDIEAYSIISKSHKHGLQYNYDKLCADIYPASPEEFDVISKWVINTTPHAHRILSIYCINRHEDIGKSACSDALLFHGSRNINYHGIIKNGLKIKPYGVQTAGSLFGNGIYFTNSSEKCMHYARNPRGVPSILTICAVHLGTAKVILEPPPNKIMDLIISEEKPDSVFVPGRYSQECAEIATIAGIPLSIAKTTLLRPEAYMAHDEFIVYSEDKVILKYLIVIS
jgi:hypothetical protein